MRKSILIRIVLMFITTQVSAYGLQAQGKTDLGKEFYQLMLAFPDGFRSINSGPISKYDKDSTQCNSKVQISGTSNNILKREKGLKRWQLEANVLDDEIDPITRKEFEAMFNMFQNAINKMNMQGLKLVRSDDSMIKKGGYWIIKLSKWQLDNSLKNINSKYLGFTIRLEIVDFGEGGTVLRIVVTDQ